MMCRGSNIPQFCSYTDFSIVSCFTFSSVMMHFLLFSISHFFFFFLLLKISVKSSFQKMSAKDGVRSVNEQAISHDHCPTFYLALGAFQPSSGTPILSRLHLKAGFVEIYS